MMPLMPGFPQLHRPGGRGALNRSEPRRDYRRCLGKEGLERPWNANPHGQLHWGDYRALGRCVFTRNKKRLN